MITKGEFVLVVAGTEPAKEEEPDLDAALAQVAALRREGAPLKEAVRQVSDALGLKRNLLYAMALEADKQ